MKIFNKSGFSLLELVVVIAIMGIMTTIGLVSLTDSRNKKQLETEARNVVASIREAQNYALTGKQANPAQYPCSYKLSPTLATGNYIISYAYRTGPICGVGSVTDVNYITYTLKNGVTFSVVADVSFNVPFAAVSASRIVLAKGSNYYTVCVNGAGVINGLAGNVVCP